jgi:hypothetical protein
MKKQQTPQLGAEYYPKTVDELCSWLHETIYHQKNCRLGRVLTVIDASIKEPEQNKAVKDIIKEIFWGGNPIDEERVYVVDTVKKFCEKSK